MMLVYKNAMAFRGTFSGGTFSKWLTNQDCQDIHNYCERIDRSQRVVNMWNDLPAYVVKASLVKAFKNKS